MRYIVFASDYDGTLASDGRVDDGATSALEKLKASGRRLFLVTGRQLDDIKAIFSKLDLFDRVVAENGAVVYTPATRDERVLTSLPPEEFLDALRAEKIPFDTGRAIVSSWTPNEVRILEVIRRLALDYQVIFNKGAVMVLPSGLNKATGLRTALKDLGLSLHNTVGIGDAENDHAFLSASECGVAVANAVPSLRERADIVTTRDHGAGVVEIVEQLLKNDLQSYDTKIQRSSILLGTRKDSGKEIRATPNRNTILVAGASASGKSSAVAGILEKLSEQGYQFCLFDPEGDFEHFGRALSIGTHSEGPDPEMVAKALNAPQSQSIVVNLMAIPVHDRPAKFATLLPKVIEMRAKTARPHWLVVDEAHHLMPTGSSFASSVLPQELGGMILLTVRPEHVAASALALVDIAMATGDSAGETLRAFANAIQTSIPGDVPAPAGLGEALVWFLHQQAAPVIVKTLVAKAERRRHRRNYAQGELSPEQSFYFRGRDSKLNLRAQNLTTFLQLLDGVDDDTWLFHLQRGDYSRWFESVIKDEDLAASTRKIERDARNVGESRARLKQQVESRYTAA